MGLMQRIKGSTNEPSYFKQLNLLILAVQVVLSASVFSLFMSLRYNYSLYTFSFKLFTYSTDRNYIFLLCNGILVFLLRNCIFHPILPPYTSDTDYNQAVKIENDHLPLPNLSETKPAVTATSKGGVQSGSIVEVCKVDNVISNIGEEYQDEEEQLCAVQEDKETEEVKEDEEKGFLSAEELNKRCEEFIRLMKEKIKTEAQNPIIVQNRQLGC